MSFTKISILLCCLLFQHLGYSQRMSKEEMKNKLYGLWHFDIDSTHKDYAVEVLNIVHKGDSMEIKRYNSRNYNGYILFELTDSTNTSYYFERKSKTGYYLLETNCTMPICHDPRADVVITCYNIESVTNDSLKLYVLHSNQIYILTKEK